jgi:hypothetical protein
LHRLVLALEELDLLRELVHPLLLSIHRFQLVFDRLHLVFGERHPLLLIEVLVDHVLG